MCGIVGCVGHENATGFVTGGLKALEYRGYDSAGIAYPDQNDQLNVVKAVGYVSVVEERLPALSARARTALGHTRWATHGGVTESNAHPHTNLERTIAVVHNGTIENHRDLLQELTSNGYQFTSDTDTEVVPHLLDFYLKEGQEPGEAFTSTMRRLVGAYAILALFQDAPDSLYAARAGSPLVLGINGSEHFAASDPSVLIDKTKKAIFLDEHEIAELSTSGYKSWHLAQGHDTTRPPEQLSDVYEKAYLGEFSHYMIKEIYESPETVRAAISGRIRPQDRMVKLGGLEEKKRKT